MAQIRIPKNQPMQEMNIFWLAQEIAGIVESDKRAYPIYNDDSRFQVGDGNNFWLSMRDDAPKNYVLTARYWSDEQLEAVLTILQARQLV